MSTTSIASTAPAQSTIADFQPVVDTLTELAKLAPHLPVIASFDTHRFDDGRIWIQLFGLTVEQVRAWGAFLGEYQHRDGSDVHIAEGYVCDVLVRATAIEKASVAA